MKVGTSKDDGDDDDEDEVGFFESWSELLFDRDSLKVAVEE